MKKLYPNTLTRLQPGMVVVLRGEQWRVSLVNECRAHCVPVRAKERVVIRDWSGAVRREYWAQRRGIDISPNSEVEVV